MFLGKNHILINFMCGSLLFFSLGAFSAIGSIECQTVYFIVLLFIPDSPCISDIYPSALELVTMLEQLWLVIASARPGDHGAI